MLWTQPLIDNSIFYAVPVFVFCLDSYVNMCYNWLNMTKIMILETEQGS